MLKFNAQDELISGGTAVVASPGATPVVSEGVAIESRFDPINETLYYQVLSLFPSEFSAR